MLIRGEKDWKISRGCDGKWYGEGEVVGKEGDGDGEEEKVYNFYQY